MSKPIFPFVYSKFIRLGDFNNRIKQPWIIFGPLWALQLPYAFLVWTVIGTPILFVLMFSWGIFAERLEKLGERILP